MRRVQVNTNRTPRRRAGRDLACSDTAAPSFDQSSAAAPTPRPRTHTMIEPTALYLAFCLNVRELCLTHDATVTSWWRSGARNRALDGHPSSFHLEGLAADLVPEDPTNKPTLLRHASALGLQAVDEGDHVHIELDYRHP
ncbi:MAG: D-Ala-D-Ala carboxypeptidase family metallohydrolase [Burkholderiales bacterium]